MQKVGILNVNSAALIFLTLTDNSASVEVVGNFKLTLIESNDLSLSSLWWFIVQQCCSLFPSRKQWTSKEQVK